MRTWRRLLETGHRCGQYSDVQRRIAGRRSVVYPSAARGPGVCCGRCTAARWAERPCQAAPFARHQSLAAASSRSRRHTAGCCCCCCQLPISPIQTPALQPVRPSAIVHNTWHHSVPPPCLTTSSLPLFSLSLSLCSSTDYYTSA